MIDYYKIPRNIQALEMYVEKCRLILKYRRLSYTKRITISANLGYAERKIERLKNAVAI